jgi:hypothetical protein
MKPYRQQDVARVFRAAMRWYRFTNYGTVKNWPERIQSYKDLRKACAAAERNRRKK